MGTIRQGSKKFSFNRRAALAGFTSFVSLASLKYSSIATAAESKPTQSLAIIGAGMGGISTAYFCGSAWNIDVFESESQIGGHADTRRLKIEGKDLSLDLGAEFFHPDTHPLYWNFLEHIGAHTPGNKSTDLVIEAPASLCIFNREDGKPFFSSGNPIENLIRATNFFIFSSAARKMVDSDESYEVSMGEWLDKLKVTPNFKTEVLSPWLASLSCVDVTDLRRQSARSHLSAFAKTFPSNLLKSPKTYNSKIGLGGYIEMLKNRCQNLQLFLDHKVSQLEEVDGKWFVLANDKRNGPYDAVVVNAPPHISKDFFTNVSWADQLKPLLDAHEYYETRIAIHTDPIYMPKEKKYWSVQNAAVGEGQGEASVWLGEILHEREGEKLNLFKSWALKRSEESTAVLSDRKFLHPLSTPSTIRAIRDLKSWQGRNNLYFAGHFTTTTDLQETALFSALETARLLSPESPELVSFTSRLEESGLSGLNYDIPT